MKKSVVIGELLTRVRTALEAKLTDEEYSEYLKGSVSFRLDLVRKPEKHFITVTLPQRKAPKTPNTLEVGFVRRYSRRQCLELPPETIEELNAKQG
jgi:hypothetical protein